MQLELTRDLVFFDIESTGLNVVNDRIVQIALIKYPKGGGEPLELEMLINPGIPISAEAMAVHGITPQDVARKPVFAQVAQELYDFIGSADLAGYNSNRFDVPMLLEEFARVGLEFDITSRRLIDVQRIFYKMEPRTLSAALKYYCQQEMTDAHDALADVRATVEVLAGQLAMYADTDYEDGDGNLVEKPIRPDVKALHDFTNDLRYADATQKLRYEEGGKIVFNFGKYNGKTIAEVNKIEPNYCQWILNKEFSSQVKQIVRAELKALRRN
jgi:DNA polymerase-3 subunit epsilon